MEVSHGFSYRVKQVMLYGHRNTSPDLKSILFSITRTRTLVLRRGDIEAVTQG